MSEWDERVHIYICGCSRRGEDDPPALCPEHQVGYVTLTCRPRRKMLAVLQDRPVEDVLRDLEQQLLEGRGEPPRI